MQRLRRSAVVNVATKAASGFRYSNCKQHSVREFINLAAEYLDMKID